MTWQGSGGGREMRVGSLFSGIGGMDAGLARAGLRHVFLCESDEWRRGVLAARFPGVPIYDDVRSVGGEALTDGSERGQRDGRSRADARRDVWPARVDLLCGGFPCQDLSAAGQRAGLQAGARSSLFFEFARVADDLVRPGGWVLVENVPGLLSSQGGRDFGIVLATLAELGFHDCAWRVLDSRHFGVPQRRRRVFVLARRCASGDGACQVLLEPESGGGHPQAGGEAGPGVAGTLGGGSGSRGWAQDVERMTFIPDAGPLGGGNDGIGRRTEDDPNLVTTVVAVSENQRGEVLETDYAHQLTSGGGKPGQGYPAARTEQGVRRLTPVECERLQALPDNWTAPDGVKAPDSRRYAALGDAVTASVAEWIGRRLMTYEQSLEAVA